MNTIVREPLYRRAPDCRQSFGDLARRVAVELCLPPDDEQQDALDALFAERAPGEPAARHACIVGARQNIKTSTLEVAAATDLLVLGIPGAVWTAHESKTSTKSYQDLIGRLLRSEDFSPLIDHRAGRGEERIFLLEDPGISLEYRARSGGSGRGFTTARLTLDEALYLRAGDMGALMPTMLTRRDAQVRYGSSGGFVFSEVLRDLRRRAQDGSDPRLFYVEYGAERRSCALDTCSHLFGQVEGCALDDPELWWQANSALWCGRIDEENILDLRRSMPPAEFMREVLVWWDEPPNADGGALDFDRWLELADGSAERGSGHFGIAVAPDRSWSAVGVAWRRPDGAVQVMVSDYRPGAGWVIERVRELRRRWGGTVTANPAAHGLVEGAVEPGTSVQAAAHSAFADAVTAGTVRHGSQGELDTAVRAARWRPVGDTRIFDRKGSVDISPLDAVALAFNAGPRGSGKGRVIALS